MEEALLVLQRYIEKQQIKLSLKLPLPDPALELCLIIPAYNEKHIENCLDSLLNCHYENIYCEIIVILNHSIESSTEIKALHLGQFVNLTNIYSHRKLPIHILPPVEFSTKHAGVGSARKYGMDIAVTRFLEVQNSSGIILNFDADCTCHPEYLNSVIEYFNSPNARQAVSIGFKHRLDQLNDHEKKAILHYERHLLYYINAQKSLHYPFAFQTLGSCFAVKADAYCQQGGMNRRQAGEDFYFLHKFSKIKQLGEIKRALVYPSGRQSDRVPFGTGKAIRDILEGNRVISTTYNFYAIQVYCAILKKTDSWYKMKLDNILQVLHTYHKDLFEFLMSEQIDQEISRVLLHTGSFTKFKSKIEEIFSPFLLMKWLHFARNKSYPDMELDAAESLLSHTKS